MFIITASLIAILCVISKAQTASFSFLKIECVSVTSGERANGTQTVSCGDAGSRYANFVMTGCGYRDFYRATIESYINTDGECVATGTNPRGIQAIAQCCDIGDHVSCSTISGSGDGTITTVDCVDASVVGCVSHGTTCADATDCDDAIVNGNGPISNQICTGHKQRVTRETVNVQSVCCSETSEEKQIECQQIIGPESEARDDGFSIVTCKNTLGSEWFLTSCNSYVTTTATWDYLDGHFAIYRDRCYAQNSNSAQTVRAVAHCCRIATTVTCTSEPSPQPTPAPTRRRRKGAAAKRPGSGKTEPVVNDVRSIAEHSNKKTVNAETMAMIWTTFIAVIASLAVVFIAYIYCIKPSMKTKVYNKQYEVGDI